MLTCDYVWEGFARCTMPRGHPSIHAEWALADEMVAKQEPAKPRRVRPKRRGMI
jgi:hypothetical protein